MKRLRSLVFAVAIALAVALLRPMAAPAAAAPDGQITFAIHVSLAPAWFDPAETPGVITPFMTLYAIHDALVKPMPGNAFAPSLAESWTASRDGLSYEFVLRKGVRFHNGDTVSVEDDYKADQEKQFKHLVRVGSAAAGNVATRIEAFVISGGNRAYGGYPDIDALFRDQAEEMDKKRREAMLHKIQQLMHERAMFAPILEPAFLIGVGPRMGEVPTIAGHPYFSPYEDLTLKGR
jgi:ABC-type transport system substrate-binding protein